jgi:signal transduction histidine kinase
MNADGVPDGEKGGAMKNSSGATPADSRRIQMAKGDGGKGRLTGIEVIGSIPWGSHFCLFYNNKEDMLDILVPYFRAGLENNEFCLWATMEPLPVAEAKRALGRAVKNLPAYLAKGQIEILEYNQWYIHNGQFNSDDLLRQMVAKEQQAVKKGFAGLRLSGNTLWLQKNHWQSFMDFETASHGMLEESRAISLCSFPIERFQLGEILDVFSTHQCALIRRHEKWEKIENIESKRTEKRLWKSHEQLRALSTHLQKVREEEQARLSRELHDNLGQTLTALKMSQALMIRKLSPEQTELAEKINSMTKLTDEMIQLVRRIATDLRPGILDDLGLVAALEWQFQDFQKKTGLSGCFSTSKQKFNLAPEQKLAVFRIFQEALNNIILHAGATQVGINVKEDGNNMVLAISDNGRGITAKEMASLQALGLIGMRERASLINGEVRITGVAREGTTVQVIVPQEEQ